jgi:hypothetical protein
MKVSSFLFALLVCGALSTDAAMARHHGHHFRGSTEYKFHARSLAKGSATGSNPQDVGSKPQTGIADHATVIKDGPKPGRADTRIDDDKSAHDRKSTKAGASDTPNSNIVHSPHGTVAGGSNSGSKDSVADGAIDTRITVHQRHEIGKSTKEGLFKKPKSAVVVGTGLNQQHLRDRQSLPIIHRNTIGAIVVHDKTVKHDTAAASPVAAPVPVPTRPVTTAPTLATGAPAHNSSMGVAVGAASTNGSSPAAAQTDNRAAGNAAIVIVAKNAPSISGTGLSRPGSGTSAVGGSPRIVAGVISGNSVHLKHP